MFHSERAAMKMRRLSKISLVAVVAALSLARAAQSAHSQQAPQEMKIWDFDYSLANPLGGGYNVFQHNPSSARSFLDGRGGRPTSLHSLRLTVHREAGGFCGAWFEFYAASDIPQRYLDASAYRFLSFWIKGEKGGEDFDITLKDDTWRNHEDSNPTRSLHDYLPNRASTDWQEVLIPLRDFKGLDSRRLFNMTFLFTRTGDQRVYVDDIGFKTAESQMAAKPPADSPAAPPTSAKTGVALWVWNTTQLLDPDHLQDLDRFFAFCGQHEIHEIFLSLEIHPDQNSANPHYTLNDPARYQAFLERAHKLGMTVASLNGTPEWAVRPNHAQALAAIDTVIDFNRASPPQSRFDAVHFDVEPYSLVGYADPEYRPELLREFLEMVSKCVERVHTAPGLSFECDVPAWFYPRDMLGRQDLMVEFNGAEKTVGEHLTDLLDSVTIMDYRNEADGAGGIIMGGMTALEYAAWRGRKIQVGLETSIERGRSVYFVCGLPLEEFRQRLPKSGLRDKLYFGDYRLSTLSDDVNVHIGLAAPEKLDVDARIEFEKALASLALELGASSDPKQFPPDEILDEARFAVESDPELNGFEKLRFADPKTLRTIVGFITERHMSPKITFHGLSRELFTEETSSVVEWLSPFKSFQGLAIHYYESYRDLVEGK
jgi:Carbohydrate binding domain 30